MQPFPNEASVIVHDNFVTHHGKEYIAMMENAGMHVQFTAVYSPDTQPLEYAFAQIKAFCRRNSATLAQVRSLY